MLVKNAEIYTMDEAGIIKNGYILTDGKKIKSVGDMADCPSYDGETIDANGMTAYPGFIDAHTHLGMWEDSLGFEGDDGNEESDPCTPQVRAIDAINPCDRCFNDAVAAGITTVVSGPGSANPVGGQMVIMKTVGSCIDDMVYDIPFPVKFALGENPKKVYSDKNQAPATRMATAAIIREQLSKAQRYTQSVNDAERDEDLPEYDQKCEALIDLMEHRTAAHFHAHRLDDIYTAARIAKEFQLKYVIIHATSAHTQAEDFAKKGINLFCGPIICDRAKPELHDLEVSSPGILANAGAKVCLITDHPVVPVQYLPLCAGLAIGAGMNREDALKALTVNPAEICGISDRVGTITAEKDADFSLFSGDPFTLNVHPEIVVCNGDRVKA